MRETLPTHVALILEDESRFRGFLAEVVGDLDCTPLTAGDGNEAMRLAKATPPDFVILDLNLPRVSGLEFLERFRRRYPDPPVVVITGYGDLDAAKAAIRLGVTDFLTKPCDLGQIEAAIDRARRRVLRPDPAAEVHQTRPASPSSQPSGRGPEVRPLEDVERDAILEALRVTGGNRTAAAKRLGISRRAVHNKILEYRRQGFEVP